MSAKPQQSDARASGLAASPKPLCDVYDVCMLDLDGVVYRGDEPIPAAAAHLEMARRHGMTLAFVTNNASRTPAAVAETLRAMGVQASAASVVTSAQAVARLIAERFPSGGRVLMVGGEGLDGALREHGLVPVLSADDKPDAVVQGFSPELGWRALVEACVAIGRGVPWFASNTDRTIPTARGIAPGNGTFVEAVRAVVGGDPVVAGKPEPALFAETALRVGGGRALVVGDRLDTDIAGARRFGADSLLVLTGVTDLRAVAEAAPPLRPDFLGWDLASLCSTQHQPRHDAGGALLNGWAATLDADGAVALRGTGPRDDALRLVVALAWQHLDATGVPADVTALGERLRAASSGG